MKPFDLEKALAGEPVVTRDGREVTQLHLFDTPEKYKLYGVISGRYITCWDVDGNYTHGLEEAKHDLLMKEKVIKGWCNIYQEGDSIWISHPHESEERAKKTIMYDSKYIKTIKITNEK